MGSGVFAGAFTLGAAVAQGHGGHDLGEALSDRLRGAEPVGRQRSAPFRGAHRAGAGPRRRRQDDRRRHRRAGQALVRRQRSPAWKPCRPDADGAARDALPTPRIMPAVVAIAHLARPARPPAPWAWVIANPPVQRDSRPRSVHVDFARRRRGLGWMDAEARRRESPPTQG